ncbi:MAG: ABC transporter permease [Polyangiales bacterium]
MFHSKTKFAGTLFGVVFAVVLVNQQLGVFLGLVQKNTMFVDHTQCDVWITQAGASAIGPATPFSIRALTTARAEFGVAWAEPLLVGGASIRRPDGQDEAVTLIGAQLPRLAGGPWNMVVGDAAEVLVRPSTLVLEDSQRDELGGANVGVERELNGHRVFVGGFSWGLVPFGAPYAFASYGDAEVLLHMDHAQTNYVLVQSEAGQNAEELVRRLQRRLPNLEVRTSKELSRDIVEHLLTATPIGLTFGVSALFGLIVGLVIVSLSMFSSVVDNIREFGTLKAIGATNGDLTALLFAQALAYAGIGLVIGLFAVTRIAEAIRSPTQALNLSASLFAGAGAAVVTLCLIASLLALLRVRRVEPGIVFR